eukprot:355351-Chlamydomonas_euryale.AAC.3
MPRRPLAISGVHPGDLGRICSMDGSTTTGLPSPSPSLLRAGKSADEARPPTGEKGDLGDVAELVAGRDAARGSCSLAPGV